MELNKSENHVEESTQSPLVLQYDDQFPPLPICNTPKIVQNSKPRLTQTKSSVVTQTLVVPLAERRFSNRDANNSIKNDAQKKICQNVAQKCGVTIELNSGKDQNLSVFISGPQENVFNAKRILAKELQTQTQLQIKVPKEYHKFILGRSGASLKEIECNSSTNITIPRSLENSDLVTIYGTKEGIDKARNEINQIVSERSKLATERITIPKRFYPFINGANNSTITKIREMTNVKINIPPTNVDSEEIIISGDKEGVYQALNAIQKIYDDTKKCSSSLNLPIPKSQHCYVIGAKGSGIAEIFDRTGVSIEMPSQESDDDTIVLYGPNEALAPALSMVIQKSESMIRVNIEAPNWLHRFIIGKQGSNLNKLLDKYERVFINFQDNSDSIIIEGPKEDVNELKSQITAKIAELKSTMAIAEIQVDPRFHRHIIGRSGANILRMQDEHKVQIRMPGNNAVGTSGWIIRIEGDPEGVKLAKAEIESMSVKLENEKTKDVILDHKYHNQLIGAQGNRVKELRNQFPDVIIMFPDLASKSDIVQLRGPRQQVDQVAVKLNKFIQEVIENNYTKDVKIFKQYHKNIIGKGGSNIRKIREETNIRIDFPDEHSDSDKIRLTGKKENVEEAAKRIEAMQADLISIKEDSISIPHRLHISLIGTRGKLIKCIQQDCGGVQIQFPPSDSNSDIIKIRGPEADVDKAKKQLSELSEKNLLLSHQDSVIAKSDFHKFLIGRKGAHLTEFRKRHAVMLIFPDSEDTNKDVIQIIGAKEVVQKAKEELEETIKSLENEIEKYVTIDTKWHKHFFKKRQAVMEEISREFGGVRIFFPKQDAVENVDQVRVIGPKGCVEAAIVRIEDIIENLEAQTNISVFIEQKHHRNLITRNMTEIKSIQNNFDVMIKFPNRDNISNKSSGENGGYEEIHMNGGNGDNFVESTEEIDNNNAESEQQQNNNNNPANWVTLSGRREHCEFAKEALLELVPVTEDVPLINEFHRNFIGQKGQGINTFSIKYNVVVNIPPANKCFDFISIKGPRANVIEAKTGLDELIVVWENEKQDRIARNYENQVTVPVVFHRKLIGQRGTNIEMFRNKFNVSIQIPDLNSKSDEITIRGYEEDVKKAEEELLSIVERLKAHVIEELHIPRDVHPQLIGSRGLALRKLREQFDVEINFPHKNADDDNANRVEVIGDKENVDKCCDVLLERANELLYEWEERNSVREVKNSIKDRENVNSNNLKEKGPGFLLAGAPWQRVPDATSNVDFPTIDANGDKIVGTCLLNGHSE